MSAVIELHLYLHGWLSLFVKYIYAGRTRSSHKRLRRKNQH